MNKMPDKDDKMKQDIKDAFGEMQQFLQGKPGDEIELNVNGLINNTDIFAVYQSANLLNGKDYSTLKNTKKDGSVVAKK